VLRHEDHGFAPGLRSPPQRQAGVVTLALRAVAVADALCRQPARQAQIAPFQWLREVQVQVGAAPAVQRGGDLSLAPRVRPAQLVLDDAGGCREGEAARVQADAHLRGVAQPGVQCPNLIEVQAVDAHIAGRGGREAAHAAAAVEADRFTTDAGAEGVGGGLHGGVVGLGARAGQAQAEQQAGGAGSEHEGRRQEARAGEGGRGRASVGAGKGVAKRKGPPSGGPGLAGTRRGSVHQAIGPASHQTVTPLAVSAYSSIWSKFM
jgi:hypothetical protein